ncbi:class I SAM-dependent methyltransferase [Caballeronia sp. GAOx1]|uniref:class I SAM-dependent methyltransferase n=1 Tax=Caballeronia sp. GAOx1 TaxID=2921761 RepID=UPI002028775E|nr:class I SAM-dependent methyltransferase [Caballeronia sp. GAOx1]
MASVNRFNHIGFEDFRRFAQDESMSNYERIGFPDSYRQGYEAAIHEDICRKLTNLRAADRKVVDIGPGCSDLPKMLISLCGSRSHSLTLIDSQEMLNLLDDAPWVEKVGAMYPRCRDWIAHNAGKVDVILCYSVLHYIFVDVGFFDFLDSSLSLLAPGGQMLIGDIPNVSKRKRFFASATGVRFHKDYMKTDEAPVVEFNTIEPDQIDDAVVMALIQRARSQGYDAYVLPQAPDLPLSNRREDILITRP